MKYNLWGEGHILPIVTLNVDIFPRATQHFPLFQLTFVQLEGFLFLYPGNKF